MAKVYNQKSYPFSCPFLAVIIQILPAILTIKDNRYILKNTTRKHTLTIFDFFPRLLRVLVNEALTPSICVPPSTVRMLLAYPSIVSEYASEHLVVQETITKSNNCDHSLIF